MRVGSKTKKQLRDLKRAASLRSAAKVAGIRPRQYWLRSEQHEVILEFFRVLGWAVLTPKTAIEAQPPAAGYNCSAEVLKKLRSWLALKKHASASAKANSRTVKLADPQGELFHNE